MKKILIFLVLLLSFPTVSRAQMRIETVNGKVVDEQVIGIDNKGVRIKGSGEVASFLPFSVVKSIRFEDGCTLHFQEEGIRFDELAAPYTLVRKWNDLKLEGVYHLNAAQEALLLGSGYPDYRKAKRAYLGGEIMLVGGLFMLSPVVFPIASLWDGDTTREFERLDKFNIHIHYTEPIEAYKAALKNPVFIAYLAGTAGLIGGGIWLMAASDKKCRRIVSLSNDGMGVAFRF